MKNKTFIILAASLFLTIIFCGCFEEDNNDSLVKSYTLYVDDDGGANYTKIQDAIDHLTDGGSIYVYDGIYNEILKIDKSINLIGANADTTIIYPEKADYPNSNSVVFINADNCTIKEFKITCVNFTSDSKGILINSSNNTISNNVIMYSNMALYLDSNSKNNTISLNRISNASHGIEIINSYSNNIFKNNISSCTTYGIYTFGSDYNIFDSNMLFNNNYGFRIKGSKYNQIFNNVIINNKYGILCCCAARNNVLYNNVFEQNSIYNARDDVSNQWDNEIVGNFWDDYEEKYPEAIQIDNIWDIPYKITGDNMDRFPLVNPVDF